MRNYIHAILILIIVFLGWQNYQQNLMIDKQTVQLSSKNENDNKHTTVTYDQHIETLKKNNKLLYDSLKIYKDEIDYLTQFKYQKQYVIDDTIVKNDSIKKENVTEYVYTNEKPNDTLNYVLKIGSFTKPQWYSLKLDLSEKFTIVNKKINNINETTIAPSSNSNISDVTIVNVKEKENFLNKIRFGPSITAGYCLMQQKIDIMIGLSAIIDL